MYMAGRFLPDTNIVIALFAAEQSVVNAFSAADEVFLSTVVLGELYYGARKSTEMLTNILRRHAFAGRLTLYSPGDLDTARHYGAIKELLRGKGKMISENDIWIAASALQ